MIKITAPGRLQVPPRTRIGCLSLRILILIALVPALSVNARQFNQKFEDELIALMEVRPGMAVADIGAGGGGFAIKLVRAVGPEGRVYANEIDARLVRKIESKKKEQNLSTLIPILGEETDPVLPERVDYLFLIMTYHHLTKPGEFMQNSLKYLKPKGRLVIVAVDIDRAGKRNASHKEVCVSDPVETRAAVEHADFVFEKLAYLESSAVLYVLIFKPADDKEHGFSHPASTGPIAHIE